MKFIICITLLFLVSCNNDPTDNGSGKSEYATLIDNAWLFFETGDFTGAESTFMKAKNLDLTKHQAYNGLAWSQIYLDKFSDALTNANQAILITDTIADYYAARAIIYKQSKEVNGHETLSTNDVLSTLQYDFNWSFSHKTTLTANTLRIIQVQNHFSIENYSECVQIIKLYLDQSYNQVIDSDQDIIDLAEKIESYNINI
jgi:tetratricopeptide (TPR) repeat protein